MQLAAALKTLQCALPQVQELNIKCKELTQQLAASELRVCQLQYAHDAVREELGQEKGDKDLWRMFQ